MAGIKLQKKGKDLVIFRRIKGRLVPIKVSGKSAGGSKAVATRKARAYAYKKDLIHGAAFTAGGLGVTIGGQYGSGYQFGKGVRWAQGKFRKAMSWPLGKYIGKRIEADSLHALSETKLIHAKGARFARVGYLAKKAGGIKGFATFLGGGLIGVGVKKAYEDTAQKKAGAWGELAAHATGHALSLAGLIAFRKGIARGFGGRVMKIIRPSGRYRKPTKQMDLDFGVKGRIWDKLANLPSMGK